MEQARENPFDVLNAFLDYPYICYMRHATALFFISLYMVAMLKPAAPVVDYIVNHEYIAEVLCVNKENTKLQCNGTCHLKKELKKAADDETENGFPISTKISVEDYPIGFIQLFSFKSFAVTKDLLFNTSNHLLFEGFSKSLFQPPEL